MKMEQKNMDTEGKQTGRLTFSNVRQLKRNKALEAVTAVCGYKKLSSAFLTAPQIFY